MKVKLLNTAGYFGLEDVVGKTLDATEFTKSSVHISGRELNEMGAEKDSFFNEMAYCFFKDIQVEVEE